MSASSTTELSSFQVRQHAFLCFYQGILEVTLGHYIVNDDVAKTHTRAIKKVKSSREKKACLNIYNSKFVIIVYHDTS